MMIVQRDGILRHRHHPHWKFDCLARETARQSLAVPALVDLAGLTDILYQAE
jgi:hypothetical protein